MSSEVSAGWSATLGAIVCVVAVDIRGVVYVPVWYVVIFISAVVLGVVEGASVFSFS